MAASLPAVLPAEVRAALSAAQRRLSGDYEEDEWGFDPGYAQAVQPLFDFLYDRWWRVHATGVDSVPARGPALIVANHAGVLPYDALMLATAIRRATAARDARFLVLDRTFELPWAGVAMRRIGAVPASSHNALGLLKAGHVAMAFPEGAMGTGKPYSERYRIERFGRGGFIEVALRAQAPIIPCAVVGSEEIYPVLRNIPLAARLLRTPFFPLTPTFPLLGPLGLIPLPSKWHIAFGAPIDLGHPPQAAEDRALVLSLSDRVRETLQRSVHDTVIRRKAAFL